MHRLISLIALPALVAVAAMPLAAWPAAAATSVPGQQKAEIRVHFATAKAEIDPALDQNRQAFSRIDSLLTAVSNDSSWVVKHISITGSASPEGPAALNRRLSKQRADAISSYFASYTDSLSIPTDYNYIGADWDGLRSLVETRGKGMKDRDAVVSIINSGSADRLQKLKRLSGGATYRQLLSDFFPELRSSVAVITLHREKAPETILSRPHIEIVTEPEPDPEPEVIIEPEPTPEPEPVITGPAPEPQPADGGGYIRNLYIKTNAVGWAMAITNIAFEFDITPHFTVALPLYYSAWEYGSHRVKFRTCAFQPELRLWSQPDNTGFFGGAHFGVAQFNMALGGHLRFQDHNGHSPALGGGLSVGYRRPLGHSGRWLLEFSLGAGVYSLFYDAFDNSSVAHGQKVYEKHKTFVGIDNVGVTFSYTIPLERKGGRP